MSQPTSHVAYGIRPSQGSLLIATLICVIVAALLTAIFSDAQFRCKSRISFCAPVRLQLCLVVFSCSRLFDNNRVIFVMRPPFANGILRPKGN